MREEARFWVDDATWDLECAQDMLDHGRHNYASMTLQAVN